MLLYLDLHSLARIAEYDELDLTSSQQRMLKESLGSLAAVIISDDGYNRLKFALTLFPETE